MGKNSRRRREPQRPSASKARPSPGSGPPQDDAQIPLEEGLQQLAPVCSLRRAVRQAYTAWSEGDLPVWRDGKLADPDEYSFGIRTDVDGRERLKVRKGMNAVTTDGSRLLDIDQTAHRWETSAAGIAALRAKLSLTPEQLIAEQVAAAIAELPAAKDGIDVEAVKQLIDEKLAAAAKVSQRRKPGPKADWRFIAAGEAYMFRQEHGRMPSFKELAARCDDKLDSPLDETNTYKLLTHLGVAG